MILGRNTSCSRPKQREAQHGRRRHVPRIRTAVCSLTFLGYIVWRVALMVSGRASRLEGCRGLEVVGELEANEEEVLKSEKIWSSGQEKWEMLTLSATACSGRGAWLRTGSLKGNVIASKLDQLGDHHTS